MGVLEVVIADDSLLLRQGVRAVLEEIPDVVVVAEAEDLDGLLAAVEEHTPDAVLTDVRMPPTLSDEGIRGALAIRDAHPDIGIVILSQDAEPDYVARLFEKGSARLGYLLKERVADPVELARALRSVATGGSIVDPVIVEVLLRSRTAEDSPVDRLTPREEDVLGLIAEGWNNAAIAERLVVSEKAVAKHINSIFTKLDLGDAEESHRRVRAVLAWLAR